VNDLPTGSNLEDSPDFVPPIDPSEAPSLPATWVPPSSKSELSAAIEAIKPKLAYHLHRYGLGADPLAMGHAKVLAAKSLSTYDPNSGASLNTWIDRGMQPLSRFKRLRATAVKVPEKIQLDAYRVNRASIDFEEEHGREPEVDELADSAGLSVKRLNQIQQTFRKMSGETAFEGNLPGINDTDFMSEAMEAVWDEADMRDRKILEHRTGYGGKPILQPKDVAIKLGISPVELSRRSARLSAKLDEIMEHLEK
jgi:DNA-directed RNA polymerase specialized sigma subunit